MFPKDVHTLSPGTIFDRVPPIDSISKPSLASSPLLMLLNWLLLPSPPHLITSPHCLQSFQSVQFSSVAQSCPTLCDPMNCSTPGLPVHHQLPEFTQTYVHWVGDAIQPSHPLSSPSPPAPNPSQHQSLFQCVNLPRIFCLPGKLLFTVFLKIWFLCHLLSMKLTYSSSGLPTHLSLTSNIILAFPPPPQNNELFLFYS